MTEGYTIRALTFLLAYGVDNSVSKRPRIFVFELAQRLTGYEARTLRNCTVNAPPKAKRAKCGVDWCPNATTGPQRKLRLAIRRLMVRGLVTSGAGPHSPAYRTPLGDDVLARYERFAAPCKPAKRRKARPLPLAA